MRADMFIASDAIRNFGEATRASMKLSVLIE